MRDASMVHVFDSHGTAVGGGTDFLKMKETTRRHCSAIVDGPLKRDAEGFSKTARIWVAEPGARWSDVTDDEIILAHALLHNAEAVCIFSSDEETHALFSAQLLRLLRISGF